MDIVQQISPPDSAAEKRAEGLYRRFLRQMESMVGRGTTFASELDGAGRLLFGGKFLGVFAADKQPKLNKTTPYAILNLDKTKEPGSHWIAVAWTTKGVMVYDSFGRHTENIIKLKGRTIDTDHDAEQSVVQTNCGARSLAWLILFDKFGSETAALI